MATDLSLCIHISEECPVEDTPYGYRVNLWVNCVFAAIFTIAFFANIFLGLRYRIRAYAIVLSLGCLAQMGGYGGRIGMHFLPFDDMPFLVQVCCLIFGPAFNSAAIYLMLKHIVTVFGPQWSLLKPKQYNIVFIGADIVSLILQSAGGGIVASAPISDTDAIDMGNSIMMAGVAFQVATLSIFALLALLFTVRRVRAMESVPLTGDALHIWQSSKFRWFICGLCTAFLTIYIRCAYRIAEMKDGWDSELMKEEVPFILLEGLMIVIATSAQTILHPGPFFASFAEPRLKLDTDGSYTELPVLATSREASRGAK